MMHRHKRLVLRRMEHPPKALPCRLRALPDQLPAPLADNPAVNSHQLARQAAVSLLVALGDRPALSAKAAAALAKVSRLVIQTIPIRANRVPRTLRVGRPL